MLKIFCPDFRFDSIASIPVEWLKKQQVERVILDVDNTLVNYNKEMPKNGTACGSSLHPPPFHKTFCN